MLENLSSNNLEYALSEVIESKNQTGVNKKYLAISHSQNGYTFRAVELSKKEVFLRLFGFGCTSPKKVAKALLEYANDLRFQENTLKIKEKQIIIDKIFLLSGQIKPVIIGEYQNNKWMEDNWGQLKTKSLHQILLPGTHDSGAYQVDFNTPIGDSKFQIIHRLVGYIPLVREIVRKLAITQEKSITEQLNLGIRAFDFRISYNIKNKRFMLSHTFSCIPLDEAMKQIETFMEKYPKEFIVIKAKPDYEHRKEMANHNIDFIQEMMIYNRFLIEKTERNNNLETLLKKDHRLQIYYQNYYLIDNELSKNKEKEFENHKQIWDGKQINDTWANECYPDLVVQTTKQQIQQKFLSTNQTTFNEVVLTLTPDVLFIKKFIFKLIFQDMSLKTYTQNAKSKLEQPFLERKSDLISKKSNFTIQCISEDFPTLQFIEKIISLNKILN
jgi:thiol-disulfide isomerase/thioredoxin